MRIPILSTVLMGLILGLFPACANAESVELKAMTYNVRYGTANDGENHWNLRKDIMIRSIQEYDPDVIGTQETLDFQADYIAEQLPEYRWVGIGRDKNGRGEMTAILYKWRDLVPIEVKTFWLSETPHIPASKSWDSSLHRIVTLVKFHHWKSDTFFHCYNTHFDHRGEEARTESAKLLSTFIEAHHSEDYPVILLGDFNAIAEASDAYTTFMERGFEDAWLSSPEVIGPPVTWSAFLAPVEDSNRRIDWILFRGPVQSDKVETILYNEDGRYPSDHYPVQAWLRIGEAVPDSE